MAPKPKILFLCTGNSARSQMAEALLRQHAGDQFEIYSAGLDPKPINPYTIRAMDELGIDISNQRSKSVREFMGHLLFNCVITVCSDADKACPQALWTTGRKLHWPFTDPAAVRGSDAEKMAVFRSVRDQIDTRIKAWLEELEVERFDA